MNKEQQQEQNLISSMKEEISNVLFDKFEDELSYLAVYSLIQLAYDLSVDADYFDSACAETAIFYEEDKEAEFEDQYSERIVRLCNGV
jgi:hypothetical protein